MFIYNNLGFYMLISISILVILFVFVIFSSGKLFSNNNVTEEKDDNKRDLKEKYLLKGFKEPNIQESNTDLNSVDILNIDSEKKLENLLFDTDSNDTFGELNDQGDIFPKVSVSDKNEIGNEQIESHFSNIANNKKPLKRNKIKRNAGDSDILEANNQDEDDFSKMFDS